MKPNKSAVYAACQAAFIKATDLKVGDTVRVTRVAKSLEFGWDNSWITAMNASVGKTFTVRTINDGTSGIQLEDSDECNYPFFVLEKVESNPLPAAMRINASGDYTARFNADGSINVGCQRISFETLTEIYQKAEKVNAHIKKIPAKKVAKKVAVKRAAE